MLLVNTNQTMALILIQARVSILFVVNENSQRKSCDILQNMTSMNTILIPYLASFLPACAVQCPTLTTLRRMAAAHGDGQLWSKEAPVSQC